MDYPFARSRPLSLAIVATFVLSLVATLSFATPARAGRVPAIQTYLQLTAAGTGFIGSGGVGGADPTGSTLATELAPEIEVDRAASAATPPTNGPTPAPNQTAATNRNFSGFNGLNHFDQRTSGTGAYANTQLSLEPPDQGLCVGNGVVVETVNDVVAVYSKTGTRLSGPTPLNQFLKLKPAVIRTNPPKFGDFLSDPKCYFDSDTNRFFLTVLQIDRNESTGALGPRSRVELAVSKTGDPTGVWNLLSFDVTNDGASGTPSHPHCPCIGDQPLIGADRFGFYVSTNEFGPTQPTPSTQQFQFFNGAQIYAMSKFALAAGTLPTVVHMEGGPLAEDISFSIQPATTPPARADEVEDRDAGDLDESEDGGTEFFLSSLDFNSTLDNRIAVWALGNTRSLASARPDVHLSNAVIQSQTYGQPRSVFQKDGPNPFGTTQFATRRPVPRLNSNDDRMNQVVFAHGRLYGAVNTILGDFPSRRVGIAWFVVKPELDEDGVRGKIDKQGYVSLADRQLLFPSIAVNRKGNGLITFTVVGADLFPSAAYATFERRTGAGAVHVAAAGLGPEDGFSGYRAAPVQGIARWGDYSAAVADVDGSIWLATEWIAQTCTAVQFTADSTCGGTRTFFANWGTFVGNFKP